jgi:N-acetylglucosaminyl-diphospho-decaprenol L-rhamnosyltransferase
MTSSRQLRNVDVVIVNWNGGQLIWQAVNALYRTAVTASEISVNLIVVDNASDDGSPDCIQTDFPDVRLIRNQSNRGFAAACNQGARAGNAEFILFLNPDARIDRESLIRMIDWFHGPDGARTAVLGPQICNEGGHVERTCARRPLLGHLLCRATGLHRVLPSAWSDFTMHEFDHLSSQRVGQVIGACFLTPRKLFEMLNGFDERFFVYFEEVDYCHRAALLGYHTQFLASVSVFHLGGGTTNRVKGFRMFLSLRSRIIYARKWFSRPGAMIVTLTAMGIEIPIRALRALYSDGVDGLNDVIRGGNMLWRWWLHD